MKRITIERAIEILREKYAEAEKNLLVNDPVCYALYYTWREIEEEVLRG